MELSRFLLHLVLGVALGASLVTDLRERRIPDLVTLPALAAALLVRGWLAGPGSLGAGLAGAAVALAPFLLACAVGGVGMGDVKLMAVVGAALGFPGAITAVLLVAVTGAVQALVAAARAGAVVRTLQRAAALLGFRSRRRAPAGPVTVPYGVSICVGTVLAVLAA